MAVFLAYKDIFLKIGGENAAKIHFVCKRAKMNKMKEEHAPQEITEQIRRYTDAYIKQVINFSQKGIEPITHCFILKIDCIYVIIITRNFAKGLLKQYQLFKIALKKKYALLRKQC